MLTQQKIISKGGSYVCNYIYNTKYKPKIKKLCQITMEKK